MDKWDERFIDRAKELAGYSKDPNTKVGAVIVDTRHHAVSEGFNGFPVGIEDDDFRLKDRDLKNEMMIHAEMNALLFARCDLSGFTLYVWPYAPCVRCAVHIIQAGIKRVVAPSLITESAWYGSQCLAVRLFLEAGVQADYYPRVGALA